MLLAHRVAALLGSLLGLLAGTSCALAMSVSPIHIEMTTTGSQGHAQIAVTNDSRQAMPVEVGIQQMVLDEAGGRKLSKAADDFFVFPPQATIAAGATQVFRVQWVGEPLLAESQSYLIAISQVPLKLPPGKSAVQIIMSFGVLVNVAPPQGQPALRLVQTGLITAKDGKRYPTITVENPTKVHALLPQSTIQLAGGGWSYTFPPAELSDKVGIGLVQPGKRRTFILPAEVPADVTQVHASIDFRPKR
jgi:fimbrial chaperone protein